MNKFKPLTREEFKRALEKGHGRALLHVRKYGIGEFKDELLFACLHNLNYDVQIDESRAPWLFRMFKSSDFYNEFRKALISELDKAWGDDESQIQELLGQMALAGDTEAREALKKVIFEEAPTPDGDWIIPEWVQLQTIEEFLELARIFGNRIATEQGPWVPEYTIPTKRKGEFYEVIKEKAKLEPSISLYFDFLNDHHIFRKRRKSPKENNSSQQRGIEIFTLEQILNFAHHKERRHPTIYRRFGKSASQEELGIVFNELMKSDDPEISLRLLWVFSAAKMPRVENKVLESLNGRKRKLRKAAIFALSNLSDERIHQAGVDRLSKKKLHGVDSYSLDLFKKSYKSSDGQVIADTLQSLRFTREEAHNLGFSIRDISEENNDPSLIPALIWVYENTPCTLCRNGSLEEMKKYGEIPAEIKRELKYDAYSYIHRLAKVK